ncbi:hypothetical protein BpHYR1_014138 [Brachionus plicatilis]|uniref:Uncharacterized protein n=1 Tax=Brachionus plicatilis TaxID=10195 RepID=A0A3M7Q0B5_BRAPC|nr:hypothetical protein BpHYR1_014138 [Brachionus plicatilis]
MSLNKSKRGTLGVGTCIEPTTFSPKFSFRFPKYEINVPKITFGKSFLSSYGPSSYGPSSVH